MSDNNILRTTDLSTGHLYVDPDMDEEIYGAVPVSELQDLAKEWREAATVESFGGVETGRSQVDKALLNCADELESVIENHTDE